VLERLRQIEDICKPPKSHGALYFLLRVETDADALTVAERLVREHGVAVIPGNTFGIEEGCYLRLSYGALSGDQIVEGTDRLVRGLRTIVG
jgi:aspartate/methionine/tyrosine aminotransferase